jgi:hypothetical protein
MIFYREVHKKFWYKFYWNLDGQATVISILNGLTGMQLPYLFEENTNAHVIRSFDEVMIGSNTYWLRSRVYPNLNKSSWFTY